MKSEKNRAQTHTHTLGMSIIGRRYRYIRSGFEDERARAGVCVMIDCALPWHLKHSITRLGRAAGGIFSFPRYPSHPEKVENFKSGLVGDGRTMQVHFW